MKTDTPEISAKQAAAIVALLTHSNVQEAAKACGQSETTLWRWQQEPVFATAYAQARRQAMEQALSALQKATGTATATLLAIMQDTQAPASARVTSARSVLEYAFKGVELLEMEARLAALEEALDRPEGKAR